MLEQKKSGYDGTGCGFKVSEYSNIPLTPVPRLPFFYVRLLNFQSLLTIASLLGPFLRRLANRIVDLVLLVG